MTVLNKYKDVIPADAIYIGRGSRWGNPFVINKHGNRSEVIEKHRQLLHHQIKTGELKLEELAALHGKDLVCFCKPQACHGDTLERAAAWAINQLQK